MKSSPDSAVVRIRSLPEPLHEPVSSWLGRFRQDEPDMADRFLTAAASHDDLWRLVAASEFAARTLVREWRWFGERVPGDARADDDAFALPPDADDAEARRRLRQYRNRRLLEILWLDITGKARVDGTLRSLSRLADVLIRASVGYADRRIAERFGRPRDGEGRELRMVVLAMGKLGGLELNFSSDVDLIFLYPGDGETDGGRPLSAQEYFGRLSRQVVGLLDDVTGDGFVYRVDTRLRPFGESGPPVLSFGALESYLLRHGRDWERYAYVKARVIDTGVAADTVAELVETIIEPFVYRRYLDYGVFEALREMKSLISAEAKRRQLAGNLKLGPGGIREIEFIVQSLQLVRGGGDRKLRTPEIGAALERLARTRSMTVDEASALAESYRFLRRLENFVQALRDQQTHEVPSTAADQARLTLAMGRSSWSALSEELHGHRLEVERRFTAMAFRRGDESTRPAGAARLAALWTAGAEAAEWLPALAAVGLRDPGAVAERLDTFRRTAAVREIGTTGGKRLARFVPDLLYALKDRENPAVVAGRVLGIVEQILRRSAYVALLNENPLVLERLVGLCECSAWLPAVIARYPLLLDELLDPRLYTAALTREEMQHDLEDRLDVVVHEADSERRVEVLCHFQRALLFRIAVADISGRLPIMKVSDRLTELAEIVVDSTLAIAWDDLVGKHGKPRCTVDGRRRDAGFGVVAYGKFGGMELSYGSDLDLVFLHDSAGAEQQTDGERPLDNSVFFARLVRRLTHFLTARTAAGFLYQVDTRLRPSGRSGLLVSSLEGFERYQVENAWTWEHQALLRSRPVAGSATVCREFERIRRETLKSRVRRERLRDDVIGMRRKMREQLDRSARDRFDLKQGAGGIGDIEFLVQYMVLANADRHPAVIHYSDNIRQLGVLGAAGCLPETDAGRLQRAYRDYRLRLHHLVLDEKPSEVGGDEFTDERRFVIEVWNRVIGDGN